MAAIYGEDIITYNLERVGHQCLSQLRSTNLTREDFLKPSFCRDLKLTAEKSIFTPQKFSAKRLTNRQSRNAQYAKVISENMNQFLEREKERTQGFYARIVSGNVSASEINNFIASALTNTVGTILSYCSANLLQCVKQTIDTIKTQGPILLQRGQNLGSLGLATGRSMMTTVSGQSFIGLISIVSIYEILRNRYPQLPSLYGLTDSMITAGQNIIEWLQSKMPTMKSENDILEEDNDPFITHPSQKIRSNGQKNNTNTSNTESEQPNENETTHIEMWSVIP